MKVLGKIKRFFTEWPKEIVINWGTIRDFSFGGIIFYGEQKDFENDELRKHAWTHHFDSVYLFIIGFWVLYIIFALGYTLFTGNSTNSPFEKLAKAREKDPDFWEKVENGTLKKYEWLKYM